MQRVLLASAFLVLLLTTNVAQVEAQSPITPVPPPTRTQLPVSARTAESLVEAVNDTAIVEQDSSITINVLANDVDPTGGGLTVVTLTQPAHGTAAIAHGGQSVTYTPNAGFSGTDSFTYRMEDIFKNTDQATVTVLVAAPAGTNSGLQIGFVDPSIGTTVVFRAPSATVSVQLPPGFYAGALTAKDIFFLTFASVVPPTANTTTPPPGLFFGNLEFNLTAYLNNKRLEGIVFAKPATLTVDYDPALLDNLSPQTLSLWYWNGSTWRQDGITLVSHDVAGHTIVFTTIRPGQFAFFAGDPTAATPRIYLPMVTR